LASILLMHIVHVTAACLASHNFTTMCCICALIMGTKILT